MITTTVIPDSLRHQSYLHIPQEVTEADLLFSLSSKIDSLRKEGFLAASIDSVTMNANHAEIRAFLGEKYSVNEVISKGIDDDTYQFHFSSLPISWPSLLQKEKEILDGYVKQGFINATTSIQQNNITGGNINVLFTVEKGDEYVLDSIRLIGDLEIDKEYLLSTLGVQRGDVLSQEFFDRIQEQVNASAFMEMSQPPSFYLQPNGVAVVYLPIDEAAANEFDLLIGFLPNPNPQLSQNNLLITGEGRLQLYNPFGTGKELLVDYKQLQPESPRLQSELYFPRFLRKQFGVKGSFELFKLDTSFVNLDGEFGLQYDFAFNKNLSVTYARSRSFLQRVDTNFVKETRSLPPSIDFQQNLYQFSFEWLNTNRPRNPSKGFTIDATVGIGNRTITENENISTLQQPDFDFSTLYNGINDDKLLIHGSTRLQYFYPLFSRNAILLQNQTAVKEVNQFFENDLFRIGGFNTIRGFDEQSFLASAYTVNTAEYRFLLNQDSFFSVFGDWAFIENGQTDSNNQLLGVGSGLDLATQAGIFSLNLAVGKDDANPFDFNRTRIHIGYVNVF